MRSGSMSRMEHRAEHQGDAGTRLLAAEAPLPQSPSAHFSALLSARDLPAPSCQTRFMWATFS